MPLNFSTDELAIISAQRKSESNLPRYYVIPTQQTVAISRDMEAYLILQKSTQKQKIQAWIQSLKQIQLKYTDRDSILQIYLDNRNADSEKKIKDMDVVMGGFSEFRDSLFGGEGDSARYSEISDISLMATAFQRPVDQIVSARDNSFHENVVVNLQKLKLGNQFNTFINTGALDFLSGAPQAVQNELNSWQNIVAAYPGTNG
jgi:hypothetical protein